MYPVKSLCLSDIRSDKKKKKQPVFCPTFVLLLFCVCFIFVLQLVVLFLLPPSANYQSRLIQWQYLVPLFVRSLSALLPKYNCKSTFWERKIIRESTASQQNGANLQQTPCAARLCTPGRQWSPAFARPGCWGLVCEGVAAVLQSRRVNVSIVPADYTDMWAMRGGWCEGMQIGLGSGWDGLIEIHNAASQSIERARHSTSDTEQLADEDGSPSLCLSHADRLAGGSRPAEARGVFPLSVICSCTTEAAANIPGNRKGFDWTEEPRVFWLLVEFLFADTIIAKLWLVLSLNSCPAAVSNLLLSNPWLILLFLFLTFWVMALLWQNW